MSRATKKKQKICYICGDRGHEVKLCKQVKGCFICNKKGHLAMDCQINNVGADCASQLCLTCRNYGHDMFSCTNGYDSEDLKAIECYVCKEVGHLCCVDNRIEGTTKTTCYNCGEIGHFGSDCPKLKDVCENLQSHPLYPNSGEIGHPQQPCNETTVAKVDADKDEVGSQPTKRQKSRRGGKRKKNKPTLTIMNLQWRSLIVGLYYGRPGSNIWLSPQAVVGRNHFNSGAQNLPSHQPTNPHIGTQVIYSSSPLQLPYSYRSCFNGSEIPLFSLNQENQLVLNVHGDGAIIPNISYPMTHLPHLLSNSQNRPQLHQNHDLQIETWHSPGEAQVPQNSYNLQPPLIHQNVALLHMTTTEIPPPTNH